MTPCIFSCTWLLPFVLLVTLSTGELEFYQDPMPDTPENIALKEVARYIEAQGHHRALRNHLSTIFSSHLSKKHNLMPDRQNQQDIQRALNCELLAMLLNYHQSINQVPIDYDRYAAHKESLLSRNAAGMNGGPEYRQAIIPPRESLFNEGGVEEGMKEMMMADYPGERANIRDDDQFAEVDVGRMRLPAKMPEFTFKFDDVKSNEKHPFAVRPNDPRYYLDPPFPIDTDVSDAAKASRSVTQAEEEDLRNVESDVFQGNSDAENVMFHKLNDLTTASAPQLDDRPSYHPLIVPVNHSLNNDIYFIAIVAGCSAAVMFALVLISLTWCRLQRGVKAAADIEYPAYGVTGPNKDISPSGDQRLAQSAQMYHFQHQKQQIIAMENHTYSRTSATRDPGSVSEAESDEENEEGDYTVYECPGLASTGEMEVKNPLFHDDPTPATPAQPNTNEDHI